MKRKLIDVLEQFCPGNVFLQGTLLEDEEYPDTFITFWINDVEHNSYFDDEEFSIDWDFNVIIYSSDPEIIREMPKTIAKALKESGFIPQGLGNDIPSDRPSHIGWAMDFTYLEILQDE